MFDLDPRPNSELRPRICVVGVGGAGGNAVANMIRSGVHGVEFIVANTDAQALNASPAEVRIQLGRGATQGLGAGAQAAIGKAAAEESIEEIDRALDGAHMCFVAAGMGGGTGTGAAPVVAAAARAKGILTVGVVTKPFAFEGRKRSASAEDGLAELKAYVDTLIVIPNQNLFRVASPDTTFRQAFQMADEVLEHGVRSITDLIMMPGVINLDFADIRAIMGWMGNAMLGTGEAAGTNRAIEAADAAIRNPLLDGAMDGAKGLIISITGGEDLRLMEIDEAANHIKSIVDPDADIIWGSSFLPELEGRIRVSVVATGIESEVTVKAAARQDPLAGGRADEAKPVPIAAARPQPQSQSQPQSLPHHELRPQLQPRDETPAVVSPAAASPVPAVVAPLATASEPAAAVATIARSVPIAAAPADGQRAWVTPGKIAAPAPRMEAEAPAAAEQRGASLFERMAGLARGSRRLSTEEATAIEEEGVYRRRPMARAL